MASQLHELPKYSNHATKLVASAEIALTTCSASDAEMITMNLEKLKQFVKSVRRCESQWDPKIVVSWKCKHGFVGNAKLSRISIASEM